MPYKSKLKHLKIIWKHILKNNIFENLFCRYISIAIKLCIIRNTWIYMVDTKLEPDIVKDIIDVFSVCLFNSSGAQFLKVNRWIVFSPLYWWKKKESDNENSSSTVCLIRFTFIAIILINCVTKTWNTYYTQFCI